MNLYDATADPLYWIAVVAVYLIAIGYMLMLWKGDLMDADDEEMLEKGTENSKHYNLFVVMVTVGWVFAIFDALFYFVRWVT